MAGRGGGIRGTPTAFGSSSPGLRGTSYPGWSDQKRANPNGVASRAGARWPGAGVRGFNPGGVEVVRAGTQGRRACGAPTLGWKMERRWRSEPRRRSPPPGRRDARIGREPVPTRSKRRSFGWEQGVFWGGAEAPERLRGILRRATEAVRRRHMAVRRRHMAVRRRHMAVRRRHMVVRRRHMAVGRRDRCPFLLP